MKKFTLKLVYKWENPDSGEMYDYGAGEMNYQYHIMDGNKKVGDLEYETQFGYVRGTLFGKDMPELSSYLRSNEYIRSGKSKRTADLEKLLAKFLSTKTGKKWSSTGKLRGKEQYFEERKLKTYKQFINEKKKPGEDLKVGDRVKFLGMHKTADDPSTIVGGTSRYQNKVGVLTKLNQGVASVKFDGYTKNQKMSVKALVKEQEELEEGWLSNALSTWFDVQMIEVLGTVALLGLGVAGIAGNALKNKILRWGESKQDRARREEHEAMIKKISKKFETDMKLKKMYEDLPPYDEANRKGTNARRSSELRKIAKYIKSKMTPEEVKYFRDVSKEIRSWKI